MRVAAEPEAPGRGRPRSSLVGALSLLAGRGVQLPECSFVQTFSAAHTGPDFIANGVDLLVLQDLLRTARAYCSSSGKELRTFSVYDLVEHVIKPLTSFHKCAYVELLLKSIDGNRRNKRPGLGAQSLSFINKNSKRISNKASVYVIFAYDFYLADLISALAQYSKSDEQGGASVSFWLEFVNTNFWDPRSQAFKPGKAPPAEARPTEPTGGLASGDSASLARVNSHTVPRSAQWYAHDLPAFMRHVGHVLVLLLPWSAPIVLKRSWCLMELLVAGAAARFSVSFSPRRHEEFLRVLCDDFERGLGILIDNVAIDIEKSACNNYVARAEIMDACCTIVDQAYGFAEANARVARLLSAWAVGVCRSHHTRQLAQQQRRLLQLEQRPGGGGMLCRWGEQRRREEEVQLRERECQSMYALSNLLVLAKDFALAEKIFEQMLLRLAVQGRGEDDLLVMSVRGNLALALQRQGRLEEAMAAALPLLLRKRRLLGDLHPSTVTTMLNRALLLLEIGGGGHVQQGLQLYLEVVAARSTALGPLHPETLQVSTHLCPLLHRLGRRDECMQVLREELHVRQRAFGARAPCLLPLYGLLIGLRQQDAQPCAAPLPPWLELHHSRPHAAPTEEQQRATEELLGCFEEAAAIHDEVYGSTSMVSLAFRKRFALFLLESRLLERCAQLFQTVHSAEVAMLGREHPTTADSLDTLVSLLRRGGRHEQALPLALEAVTLRKGVFDGASSDENNR